MESKAIARKATTALPVALLVVALMSTAPPLPRAVAASDGSGGRAVAHRAGGREVKTPAVASRGPDAKLFRIGMPAGEPTLGVTKDNQVFYTAIQTNTRVEIVRSKDEGKTWEVVSPKLPNGRNAQALTFDPYLFVDKATNRVFTIDLTVACSYLSFTDDRGKNWTTNPLACGRPINDHQTLFGGPPALSTPVGYESVMYYCWNDVASSACSKSLDGGLSFAPTGSPAFTTPNPDSESEEHTCGGLHGHGFVGAEGTVFLPRGFCGQPWLAISKDEGLSWTRVQVASNGISHHEAGVAADAKGNIFYTWVARDRLPYLSVSRDGGEHWSRPLMIGPPGLKEANLPGIDVGGVGKIAIVYMGSKNSPGRPFPQQQECTAIGACPSPKGYETVAWSGYMTITDDALARDPLFYTASVNDERDPLKRGTCGPGRCGTTVYDFIDIVVGPDGSVWGAFVDACTSVCTKGTGDAGNDGVVGHLVGGPSLK